MVLVEPTNIIATAVNGEYRLKPYRDRRKRWGGTFSVLYSTYEPVHYEPDFAPPGEFKEVYTQPDLPTVEIGFSVKRNMSFGSFGGEFAVSTYNNNSDNTDLSDSELNLYTLRAGGIVFLDMISPEPYVVPYASAGAYTVIFRESVTDGGVSRNGNTMVAPYVTGGVQFQIDWIDRKAARVAYESSGIESSFVTLEVRKQIKSSAAKDPDFSDDVSFAAGLRVEL